MRLDLNDCPGFMKPSLPMGSLQSPEPYRTRRSTFRRIDDSNSFRTEKPRFRGSDNHLCRIRFNCSRVGSFLCVPFCKK
uniref:Ovule protein n=1 Tax=Panagrellus redivivus TaxID=6233 RepID=A0A7E4VIU7_PANRE